MIINNKKGNVFMIILMAFILFMVGMIVMNFLMPEVSLTRIQLNCANPGSISDGTKFMCLMTDVAIPYFFILVLSISGGVILDKVLV